ncbi:MAG: phenylalanine--tRNA ligase subunit beta [Isosphaeraceae bacterium]|nr:phenylalanine--tRNA ligase subunit beta [Isosphaeraceae bacterium]
MIVSWNWLTDYLRLDMPVELLSERLALSGLNHESTEEVGGDLAIDLEVTSNRPDCLGHLGVAREISVLFERTLRIPDPRPAETGPSVHDRASVAIEATDLCSRFTARVVEGVKVGPSPWWMRKRLETLGIRPISNVVDVTNYVMFECGQPLHAYDLDRLSGRRLVVRRARAGEKLLAINNKTYDLNPEMLTISDAERPVGLAGVMGGAETEIGPGSTNVLIEAARFDAMSVRKTSRALALFSPSSYRFERPLDPEITDWASRRCAELILATAGGTLREGVVDIGVPAPARPPVTLRIEQVSRILGIAIDRGEIIRILRALGLEPVDAEAEAPTFRIPSFRSDLEREIDLIEEVARIHGYEHIPEDRAVPLTSTVRSPRERIETETRNLLTGLGYDEAITYSLVGDDLAAPLADDASVQPIRVEHSSRKRENALRRSLVPSLLHVRGYNQAHGNGDVDLFEIANVYLPRPDAELPDEPTRLGLVKGGGYLEIKGTLEALFERLHIDRAVEFRPTRVDAFAPGRAAEVLLEGERLGVVGEVSPEKLEAHELRTHCAAAELSLDLLRDKAVLVPQHRTMPTFPVVGRDLSLVVPKTVAWADLVACTAGAAGSTLESVVYLDVFAGGSIPPDRHSIHFGLRFRRPDRTLTGDEVDVLVKAIVDACASRFGAELRS